MDRSWMHNTLQGQRADKDTEWEHAGTSMRAPVAFGIKKVGRSRAEVFLNASWRGSLRCSALTCLGSNFICRGANSRTCKVATTKHKHL